MSTFFELRAEHEARNDCFEAYNVDLGQFVAGTNSRAKRQIDPTKLYGKMMWHSQARRGDAQNDGETKQDLAKLRNEERQQRAAILASLFDDSMEENDVDVASLIGPAVHVQMGEKS